MQDVSKHVERELARRAASSERSRLAILAGLGLAASIGIPTAATLMPAFLLRMFHSRLPVVVFGGGAALVTIYALASRIWVDRLRERGEMPPAWFRYLVAAVETSLPTAALAVTIGLFGPVYGLFTPPAVGYFLFIALSALHLDFALSVWTGLVAAVGYLAVASWGMAHAPPDVPEAMLVAWPHHVSKAAALLLTGVITGTIARSVRTDVGAAIRTMAERDRVVRLFGEHVSPEVAEKLLATPGTLISETRDVCVMFVDIRDFTAYSEGRSPADVVDYLNGLFGGMADDVNSHGGIVNKFLGDGFMAVFGAPIAAADACAEAVRAAGDILARVERINRTAADQTRISIGLHAGPAITGHVGSSRRREYTVMGDVVNVASRIEGLNRQFSSKLLVSDEVRRRANVEGERKGPVQVRGREQPVEIWQLI
jgi:adenylate cyclase